MNPIVCPWIKGRCSITAGDFRWDNKKLIGLKFMTLPVQFNPTGSIHAINKDILAASQWSLTKMPKRPGKDANVG